MKKTRTIAILPTGDWAEVESINDVPIVEMTEKQFEALCNEGFTENTILQINESCTPDNIDSILGLEVLNANK